jgi:O-antigen/teichoic acid export membrane protein
LKSKNLNRIGFISANAIRQVLISVFAIVIPFLVIYYSKKEIWGEFVSILLFTLIATQFINWGNKEYLLRSFSEIPREIKNTFSSNLVTRFPLVILFSIIAFFYYKLDFEIYIFLWLLGRFLIHSFEVLVVYEKKFIYSTIVESGCFIIFILTFYYFKLDLSLKTLLILYSIYQLLKGLSYLFVFRNFIDFNKISFNLNYYKISFWFFLLSVLGFLTSKIDVYIVDYFLNNNTLADYQIINSLLVFIMSISAFIYNPFIKNIYRTNKNVVVKTKKTLLLLGILIVPISILIIHFVLKYFFNLSFSVYFYIIAMFYVFPSFIYGIDIVTLFKQNKEKKVVIYLFFGILINSIITSILLYYNFGITGAMIGAMFSQILILILLKTKSTIK